MELVFEKGFDAIVIRDITDRADLGRGTFYFHFDDKVDILWSIVADKIHQTEQQVIESFEGVMPEQPEYYGYVNMFRHVDRHRDVYRLIFENRGSQEVASRTRRYLVAETITDMQAYGIYAELDMPQELAAELIVGAMFSLAGWWLENPESSSAEELGALLYRTLHHQQPPAG